MTIDASDCRCGHPHADHETSDIAMPCAVCGCGTYRRAWGENARAAIALMRADIEALADDCDARAVTGFRSQRIVLTEVAAELRALASPVSDDTNQPTEASVCAHRWVEVALECGTSTAPCCAICGAPYHDQPQGK